MALTHLADTSVLTRLRAEQVRAVIEPLASAGLVARTSMSDLEIGSSARDAREWDSLVGALEVLTLVEIEIQHFARRDRSNGSSRPEVSAAGRFPIS